MSVPSLFKNFRERMDGLESLFVDLQSDTLLLHQDNNKLANLAIASDLQIQQLVAKNTTKNRQNNDLRDNLKAADESNKRLKRQLDEMEADKKKAESMNVKVVAEMKQMLTAIGTSKSQRINLLGEKSKLDIVRNNRAV
jgi:septal ring factor EnvC (AmiA/AmiB activator)